MKRLDERRERSGLLAPTRAGSICREVLFYQDLSICPRAAFDSMGAGVRQAGAGILLPTFQPRASEVPFNRRVVEQMLIELAIAV